MTYLPLTPVLTPTQALAAATGYNWSVTPHDNGGFFAQSGEHRMIVTFAPDGSFRHANVRKGFDGMAMMLLEGDVIGALARHGSPERPVTSKEQPA